MDETDLSDPAVSGPEDASMQGARGAQIVIVTGRAGAGRSSALNAFEDLGYRTVDTPPLTLAAQIADELATRLGHRLAIGVSAQTVGFSDEGFEAAVEALRAQFGDRLSILFLDCEDETLRRRYTETRRRHPLAPAESVEVGLERDRQAMAASRELADLVLDTTPLTPPELRQELRARYAPSDAAGLSITIASFSYKRGAPPAADMVFDCRFLRNPHYDPALRPHTGRDPAVKAFIEADPRYAGFLERLNALIDFLLPAYQAEGKSYLTIAFGCTGGKHRSVAVAEAVAERLRRRGWRPDLRHRERHQAPGAASEGDGETPAGVRTTRVETE